MRLSKCNPGPTVDALRGPGPHRSAMPRLQLTDCALDKCGGGHEGGVAGGRWARPSLTRAIDPTSWIPQRGLAT